MVRRSVSKIILVSIHFPYRAVICGEEHILKGWRGRKLITDKGSFFVGHIYGDWQIQAYRLFEVALIQAGENGDWLLNGKPLSLLKSLPMGARLAAIPSDETLRVHKGKICAVAWIQAANLPNLTEFLDKLVDFWMQASEQPDEKASLSSIVLFGLSEVFEWKYVSAAWSKPVWLTEFRQAGKTAPISPQEKKLARAAKELQTAKAQLRRAEAVAGDTLKEALAKWYRFSPMGMSADTQARIEKAVKLYLTDPEMRSQSKIAAEFGVTQKTVSGWFKTFTKETGFRVVAHCRHESVREHLQADSVPKDEE